MKTFTNVIVLVLLAGSLFGQANKKANKNVAPAVPQEEEINVIGLTTRFLLKDSTQANISLRVEFTRIKNKSISLDEFAKSYTINYALYPDFGSKERLGFGSVIIEPKTTDKIDESTFMIHFEVKRPASNPNYALMLVEIVKIGTAKKSNNAITIRFKSNKLNDRLALYNKNGSLMQMRNYVTVNDTFMLADLSGTSQELYVYRYKHEFDPALSPMNTAGRGVSRSLNIDSSFKVTTNKPLVFNEEGLYYMLKDTTDQFGLGLRVTDKRYPKMTRPEALTKPVMYVSQNQEINELTIAKNQKKALDRYWLTLMNGNTEVAKQTIRLFYARVEEANRLFTTYKEGWKTDKGMVFIVMGPPDTYKFGKDREVWVYNQRANFSEINFTFNRRPNQFVEDHYELQRYVEYQPIWYPLIEAWRSGQIRD
jgi:GWxTD domain-containing protein